MSKYRKLDCCRLCNNPVLIPYLDLGEQPLANHLLKTADEPFDRYPLVLYYCERCRLSQLSVVVNPKEMFQDYRWLAGQSESWRRHCTWLPDVIGYPWFEGGLVVDIGANDGTLLSEFSRRGMRVIGVEPSSVPITSALQDRPHVFYRNYWNLELADVIVQEHGPVDVITATNVLAHVDDVHGFLTAVRSALIPGGLFVVEVPAVERLIEHQQFDTVYHEHLSYFSEANLVNLFARHGFSIIRKELVPIHGGSWLIVGRKDQEAQAAYCRVLNPGTHKNFQHRVDRHCLDFLRELGRVRSSEWNLIGVGASAKATVFINYLGLTYEDLYCVYDDNELKQGLFIPGTGIRVKSTWESFSKHDALLLLSWNIAEELKAKFRGLGNPIIYRHDGKVVVE